MKVILNGRAVEVAKAELTYEDIVALVYQPTVTYHVKGEGDSSRQGILHIGQKVSVAEGMVIDCMFTGAA